MYLLCCIFAYYRHSTTKKNKSNTYQRATTSQVICSPLQSQNSKKLSAKSIASIDLKSLTKKKLFHNK